MTRTGTSYFVSQQAANAYYADYYPDETSAAHAVEQKLVEGEIHIGKPPIKDGQRLCLIDDGRRWAIEED